MTSIKFIFLLIAGIHCQQPNFVLIVTDDQDLCMNSLMPMKKTRTLVADAGATFTNFFTTSPICCPSRATLLTGKYAHNTRTYNNSVAGGCYGDQWKARENETLAAMLAQQGYRNFYAGKYLNEYSGTDIPPGYDKFYGLQGNSKYYNYSLNVNGVLQKFTDLYLTDFIGMAAKAFVELALDEPFLMILAPPAPHQPFTPSDEYKNEFPDEQIPRKQNFNSISSDKHWLMNHPGTNLSDSEIDSLDEFHRKRWRTLLSVDDLVEAVIHSLEEKNLLENTYIFFTSDNGYHLGQFAQPYDKRQPYECDIRVPLLVRGPQIEPKTVINDLSALIDLTPTILDLAGVPKTLDGVSLLGSLKKEGTRTRKNLLIEYWGEGNQNTHDSECPWKSKDHMADCKVEFDCRCSDTRNNTYTCVRNIEEDFDYLYCEFKDHEGFVEMYDLLEDPYQLKNIGYTELPSIRAQFQLRLDSLRHCEGVNCIL